MRSSISYPGHENRRTTPLHDQIQIKLATADQEQLKSLVANCHPPVFVKECISNISVKIGVPVQYKQAADGIIFFEGPICESRSLSDDEMAELTQKTVELLQHKRQNICSLEACYSKIRTPQNVGHLPLDLIPSYLKKIGCSPAVISDILKMPRGGMNCDLAEVWFEIECEKTVGKEQEKETFKRLVRIYENSPVIINGIKYKDFLPSRCPVVCHNTEYKVLIEIKTEIQSFGEVIEQINRYRKHLGIQKAILICDTVTDSEAAGFHSQGISLYPATALVQPEPV